MSRTYHADHSICTLYCEHSTRGCATSRAYLAANPNDPDVITQTANEREHEAERRAERAAEDRIGGFRD